MTHFYNPFNFVPLNDKPNTEYDTDYCTIESGASQATHQLWQANRLSGAIFLAITNHSHLIIGGARASKNETNENGSAKECIRFFKAHPNGRLDKPERLAIPANSLRGAVVSVAEAISDSAMRVLADEKYSVRMPANRAINSVGIIRKNAKTGKFYIQPIALPPIKSNNQNFSVEDVAFFPSSQNFADFSWSDYVRFSFKVYAKQGDKLIELTKENIQKYRLNGHHPHVFAQKGITLERFHGMRNETFYYVKAPTIDVKVTQNLSQAEARDYFDVTNAGVPLLVGQRRRPLTAQTVLTEDEFLAKGSPQGYVRCILMCLGSEGRETEIANTKINEYLIPYSEQKDQLKTTLEALIRVPDSVIQSFEAIAKQTCDSGSFIKPQGWDKIDKKRDEPWKVMGGDLLYFTASQQSGELVVEKLSHSQIWRSEVTHQSLHGIVAASGHSRYLPWGSQKRKADSKLTAAEMLFGVVEDRETDKSNPDEGKALATRVRFYDAISLKASLKAFETTLTLDSPKPPSPSLYLHKNDGTGVSKADLTGNTSFQINGRKRYLQHQKAAVEAKQTGTEEMLTKAECIPPSTKPTFGFWIEFDNLTEEELSLLLLSTGAKQTGNEQPFYHQLGMGKPYGFGKCEMNVLAVLLKDPEQRYHSLSAGPVYQQQLQGYTPSEANICTLKKFAECVEHPALTQFLKAPQLDFRPFELNHAQNPLINQIALRQIAVLANDNNFKEYSIHYPMPSPQTADAKIFEWFAFNEENKQRQDSKKWNKPASANYQYLGKLADDGKVTPLEQMKKPTNKKKQST